MPFCAAELPLGLEFAESDRGGALTYHGPGQLVVYPICKLDGEGFGPKRDVSAFVRKLERLLIEEIAVCGLAAGPRENATGVWVGPRKIASIGIAVRRWVTYHGLAVNLVNDLGPFHLISPCGFGAEVMTNLAGESVGMSQTWRDDWESRLSRRIEDSARIEHLTCADVLARVERISSRASRCQVHLEGPIAPCV
jgi:lipoate-protein ligase B